MAKSKKPAPGKCIFCDEGRMSKQHVITDWISDLIPQSGGSHSQTVTAYKGLADIIRTNVGPPGFTRVSSEKHNGAVAQRKVRNVCRRCNNGWLSQLESSAKPFIAPMLTGKPVTLTEDDCEAVALAFVIMTIMQEYTTPKPRTVIVPKDVLESIRVNQRVPAGWYVAAAAMDDVYSTKSRQHHGKLGGALPFLPRGYCGYVVSTFVIGRLLVQVFYALDFDFAPEYTLPFFQQIWPPKGNICVFTPSMIGRDLEYYEGFADYLSTQIQEYKLLYQSAEYFASQYEKKSG